jgi:hypothetical protein
MSAWDKITLFKFQQVNAINDRKDMSDMDKLLFSMCAIFNLTEYQMDNGGVKRANRLAKKVKKIFSTPFVPGPAKRIGRYLLNYDIDTMTFGQYIEISHYLSAPNPIQAIQFVLASIGRKRFDKYLSDGHKSRADYFLGKPVEPVIGSFTFLIERFKGFNKMYSNLFGIDPDTSGDVQADPFNRQYGWIYSASQVAEYERIPLDAAYGLPVCQAFNDLAYLKAKSKYEAEQLKRK